MLGRPVKICLTREEVFYCHRGRHPILMKFKTGVKKDGTTTAMHLQSLIDGGGYGSYGVASTFYAAHCRRRPITFRNIATRVVAFSQTNRRADPNAVMALRNPVSAKKCRSTRLLRS